MAKFRIFLSLLILSFTCSDAAAQSRISRNVIRCDKAKLRINKQICRMVAPVVDYGAVERFTLTLVRLDLNADGRKELIAWESSWAGSSGGGLWVFARKGKHLKKLFDGDMTWSPILLLTTKHRGWSDLAYFQTGGGLDERFIVIRYGAGRYAVSATVIKAPPGAVLVRRDWRRSVFGPLK
jgi:hypothetical protein